MKAIAFKQFKKPALTEAQVKAVTAYLEQAGWVQLDNVWVSGMEALTLLGAINLQQCVRSAARASVELEVTVYDGQLALRIVE